MRIYFLILAFPAVGLLLSQSSLKSPNFESSNGEHALQFSDSGHIPQTVSDDTPHLVSHQFTFTEGPAVDKLGNIFFTDQPNDRIWEYDTSGHLHLFLQGCGRSNGMYFDLKGNLLTCADAHNQIWSISPEKQSRVLLDNFHGGIFNGPNDLWVNPHGGGIYFTDPYYKRDYWTLPHTHIPREQVYYWNCKSKNPVVVDRNLNKPNGIIGTPDGKLLYVADIGAGKTYRYRIDPGGTLSHKQLFVSQGSDGMTIDNQGNIYLTGNGVTIYNKEGELIQHIDIIEPWTANVCIGGKDNQTLFITASKSIYTLHLKVRGVQ